MKKGIKISLNYFNQLWYKLLYNSSNNDTFLPFLFKIHIVNINPYRRKYTRRISASYREENGNLLRNDQHGYNKTITSQRKCPTISRNIKNELVSITKEHI